MRENRLVPHYYHSTYYKASTKLIASKKSIQKYIFEQWLLFKHDVNIMKQWPVTLANPAMASLLTVVWQLEKASLFFY